MSTPRTVRLTMAQALVKFLRAQRVRRDDVEDRLLHGVWAIFGHGNVAGLGQALEEHGGDLPVYQPKNEQAGVHAAVAFSKAKKRLGIMAVTTSVGPGATNLVTGAATATINRLPVLLLPGDIFANRRPGPVLQQLEHAGSPEVSVNDALAPVSRFFDRINRPEQLLTSLPEAVRVLLDPAGTGAVTICLPEDVQSEAYDYPEAFFDVRAHVVERALPQPARVAEAAALLKRAQRPLLVAGGGVHYADATAALARFCEQTRIPVAMTQAGMGAVLASHPSWVGALGVTGTAAANALAVEADVVLCVGTRLSDFTTASKTQFQHEGVRFVSINVNASDAHKHGALPIVADARHALEALTSDLSGTRYDDTRTTTLRTAWLAESDRLCALAKDAPLTQAAVLRAMNDRAGPDTTVVHAAGGIPGDIHKLWRSKDAGDYHSEYGYSCMGYEIAGALGQKLATPQREVFALLGDGSYLMLANELLTSVQEDKKIVVLLLDNHGYQCIHNLQRGTGGRSFGNEFRARVGGRLEGDVVLVDFAKNAESLGARAFTARTHGELMRALDEVKRTPRSCVVVVSLEEVSRLPGTSWWDVPPSAVSAVPSVNEARAAYDEAVKKQKHYW